MARLADVVAAQAQSLAEMQTTFKAFMAKEPAKLAPIVSAKESFPERTESLANAMETFTYDQERGLTFEKWYTRYKELIEVEADHLDDAGKRRLVLRKLDSVAHGRYSASIRPKLPEDRNLKDTVESLKTLFSLPESVFALRWKCFQLRHEDDEEYSAWAARVNSAVEDAALTEITADQFKCLFFILGMHNATEADIRTRLNNTVELEPTKQTLDTLVKEARRLSNLKRDVKLGAEGTSLEPAHVAQIKNKSRQQSTKKPKDHKGAQSSSKKHVNNTGKKPNYPCYRCGHMHFANDCDFQSHTCATCSRLGHKEGYCEAVRNRTNHSGKRRAKVVRICDEFSNGTVNISGSADSENAITSHFVKNVNIAVGNRKFVSCAINGTPILIQLDTGADCTLLSVEDWVKVGRPALEPYPVRIVDAQNKPFPVKGCAKVMVSLLGQDREAVCVVCETDSSLFGTPWMRLFDLWNVAPSVYCRQVSEPVDAKKWIAELKDEFADVFNPSLGCCNAMEAKLTLIDPSATVFRPKREPPYHSRDKIEDELLRLEREGIISPVTHSRFAAPIVVVRKSNGDLRICADYSTGLNDCLQPHEYPIPTPDELFSQLSSCHIFSTIDLSNAYLQIPVDDDAKQMLTINTHRGLFTFNRLCPGVKPAAGIFQQVMDTILAGLNGVLKYFDDVLCASSNFEEHKRTLREVFLRLRKFNMRARLEKCNLFQVQLRFLGILIDRKGLRPDPAKIDAIVTMPPPSNLAEVKSFIGAVAFYSKFIKSLSTLRAPLDALTRADAEFVWTKECQASFDQFKDILCSDLLLTHFNPSLPVHIAADASQHGIGGVIYHLDNGSLKAFYHVSKKLSQTEQRYSQIEKEALSVVFSLQKFHKYVWGIKFTLHTDHRPLLSIFGSNKGVPQHTANRLQRWALIVRGYDFDIQYTRTTDFGHADVLSRLIADYPRPDEDFIIARIEQVIEERRISHIERRIPIKFQDIAAATKIDAVLVQVKEFIINGWPPEAKQVQDERVRKFFQFRESLSTLGECLVYLDRTIIPLALRPAILKSLHESHQGMSRTKALARGYVFWPGMDSNIESMIRNCTPCLDVAKNPRKVPLSPWPAPSGPWQRVHVDFAQPSGKFTYLVAVDAFSKWPEVFQMTTTTTTDTLLHLEEMCSRFGVMKTLVSDNGPQFASQQFKEFCNCNSITHLTTAYYHPQSNGLAERFVDTLKRSLGKMTNVTLTAIYIFLRDYRATPHPSTEHHQSPAELMFGRKIRLPIDAIKCSDRQDHEPTKQPPAVVAMEHRFNEHHGAVSRDFAVGERVLVRETPKASWTDAKILEKFGSSMYNVLVNGRVRRSHANQLRATEKTEERTSESPALLPLDMMTLPPKKTRKNWRAPTRTSPVQLRRRN